MFGLLIADDDAASRVRLAELLVGEGYEVLATNSVARVIEEVLRNVVKVIILGGRIGGVAATELLPILKKCKADLKVIVASEETPLAMTRRLRREGIFYYLTKPLDLEDHEELRQVVQCAFENLKTGHGRQASVGA